MNHTRRKFTQDMYWETNESEPSTSHSEPAECISNRHNTCETVNMMCKN